MGCGGAGRGGEGLRWMGCGGAGRGGEGLRWMGYEGAEAEGEDAEGLTQRAATRWAGTRRGRGWSEVGRG